MSSPVITADDVDHAVHDAVTALSTAPAEAWDRKAGSLDWDCWETAEHLADDLFAYAAQLSLPVPPLDGYLPFVCEPRRPDGPASSIFVERGAGPAGLLRIVEACGCLLSAQVRTRPSTLRVFHSINVIDPEAYAALGIVETLAHTHDIAEGLGLAWEPRGDVCARVLAHAFRDVPEGFEPWPSFLWATGRGELPGHARLTKWRCYVEPRD